MHYFSLHFHQPWNRAANRTIRMQNSLPLRNLVNYPPNTGNHEQVTGISEVDKNRLEVEGSGRTVINLESWTQPRVLRGANYTPVPGTEWYQYLPLPGKNSVCLPSSTSRTHSFPENLSHEGNNTLRRWASSHLLGEGAVTVPWPRNGLSLFLMHFLPTSNKAQTMTLYLSRREEPKTHNRLTYVLTRQGLYLGTGYNLPVPFFFSWWKTLGARGPLSMILFWCCC